MVCQVYNGSGGAVVLGEFKEVCLLLWAIMYSGLAPSTIDGLILGRQQETDLPGVLTSAARVFLAGIDVLILINQDVVETLMDLALNWLVLQ